MIGFIIGGSIALVIASCIACAPSWRSSAMGFFLVVGVSLIAYAYSG